MIDTATLLSTLRARDVKVAIEDGRLKLNAPAGALDADLKAALVAHKDDILAYLKRAEARLSASAEVVPIKPEGTRRPVFAVSGHGGDVYSLLHLARQLDPDQPMFGVQPPGLDGSEPLTTIEELARHEIAQIRTVEPRGPYLIAGHCAGGTIAFEVAQQLTAAGEEVALLALIGSPYPTMFRKTPQMLVYLGRHAGVLAACSWPERQAYVRSKLQRRMAEPDAPPEGSADLLAARHRVELATVAAASNYKPRPYAGEMHLFLTAETWHRPHAWRRLAHISHDHLIPGLGIDDRLLAPNVAPLAAAFQRTLDRVADTARKARPVPPAA